MPFPVPADEVRKLAYRLWEARGRAPGHALEDWLEAERRLAAEVETGQPAIPTPASNTPGDAGDPVGSETPKIGSRDAPGG